MVTPAGHRSTQSDRVISPLSCPYTSLPLSFLFPVLLCPMYPIYLRVAARAYRIRVHVPLGCNACAVVEHRARQLAATGASRRGSPRSSSKAGSFRVAPASGIHVARQTHIPGTHFPSIVLLLSHLVLFCPVQNFFLRPFFYSPSILPLRESEGNLGGGVGWTLVHVRIARTAESRVFPNFRVSLNRRKLSATLILWITRPCRTARCFRR